MSILRQKTEYGTLKEAILGGTEGASFPGASKANKEFTDHIPDLGDDFYAKYPDGNPIPMDEAKFRSSRVIKSSVDGRIEDTGPLTRKRMETVDEETLTGAARVLGETFSMNIAEVSKTGGFELAREQIASQRRKSTEAD